MIDIEIRNRLANELAAIESKENVYIFYACESGSRAWGFASQDSDYDVRFLYIHPTDWYLTICEARDVIEIPPEGPMDISGWDIRKCLMLLRKSNPPFLEWMQSPIVYRDERRITSLIRKVMTEYYSPRSCLHHYLHMAEGNYRDYLRGDEVYVKKYLYVLRPMLACLWIERDIGPVPTGFSELVDGIVTGPELRSAVEVLLDRKRAGAELDKGPKIPIINRFIDEHITRLKASHPRPSTTKAQAPLDAIFRVALRTIWGDTIEPAQGMNTADVSLPT